MRRILLSALACACVHAGVINGVVLEAASGHALARTIVKLQPIVKAGAPEAKPILTRAQSSGAFAFPPVASGLYILSASREFYFSSAFGQRRPNGQGTPIEVTAESNLFAELRMRRMGVLTGRVLDENDVGIPGARIVAYRARTPAQPVARGVSDDRGVYRIYGLAAGTYWVRTMSHTLEDGSEWLPTFGQEAQEIRDARIHQVRIDEETSYVDLRPRQGQLFHLGGMVVCPPNLNLGAVAVVLSSDVERKTTTASCNASFRFDSLAPAFYQIFAQTRDYAGTLEIFADHNSESASVSMAQSAQYDTEIRLHDTQGTARQRVIVTGHRLDFANAEVDQTLQPRGMLAQGPWQMKANAGEGYYVESITGGIPAREGRVRTLDAFELQIGSGYTRLIVTLSDQVATIAGAVNGADSKPVVGAPVFLWPASETARRSLGRSRQVLSDASGRYQFDNLPPGDYRLLATFDASEVDPELLDAAHAIELRVSQGQKSAMDLSLWIAP